MTLFKTTGRFLSHAPPTGVSCHARLRRAHLILCPAPPPRSLLRRPLAQGSLVVDTKADLNDNLRAALGFFADTTTEPEPEPPAWKNPSPAPGGSVVLRPAAGSPDRGTASPRRGSPFVSDQTQARPPSLPKGHSLQPPGSGTASFGNEFPAQCFNAFSSQINKYLPPIVDLDPELERDPLLKEELEKLAKTHDQKLSELRAAHDLAYEQLIAEAKLRNSRPIDVTALMFKAAERSNWGTRSRNYSGSVGSGRSAASSRRRSDGSVTPPKNSSGRHRRWKSNSTFRPDRQQI
mmetsp:Transcript_39400/g.92009  ORF Transcript_39400/g.92009 Transcript_39400/m.92009 type:complete len:292 (-) Transcript_39400:245-1120(-)